jgi:hypothetical protein
MRSKQAAQRTQSWQAARTRACAVSRAGIVVASDHVRRSRGADLAYLTALPPDQASARRAVHEAHLDTIAVRPPGRRLAT